MTDPALVYVAEHVQQCLSTDERVHALDIQVACLNDRLFLSGRVSCESRRMDIEKVARECIPTGMIIVNQIEVTRVRGSVDEEFVG